MLGRGRNISLFLQAHRGNLQVLQIPQGTEVKCASIGSEPSQISVVPIHCADVAFMGLYVMVRVS